MGSIFVNIFNAIPICFWVSCLIVSLCLGYPLILVFFPAYNHFNFRCSNFILFFWFVLMVTIYIDFLDTLVRQAAMAFKCLLLIYYKNGRGHNFRRQVFSSFLTFSNKHSSIYFSSIVSSYNHLIVFNLFQGSNVNFDWVYSAAVSCFVANTSLVPIFLEQGLWKSLFLIDYRIVSNFQANISSWEGMFSFFKIGILTSYFIVLYLTIFVHEPKLFHFIQPSMYLLGPVLRFCLKSIIKKGSSLWGSCHNGTGK